MKACHFVAAGSPTRIRLTRADSRMPPDIPFGMMINSKARPLPYKRIDLGHDQRVRLSQS